MKKYIVLGLFLAFVISVPSFAHAQATSSLSVTNASASFSPIQDPNFPVYRGNVTFTFALNNLTNGNIYISKTPSVAIITSTAGSASGGSLLASLTSVTPNPFSTPFDTAGAFAIPPGVSRTFTYTGTMDNSHGVTGTQFFRIIQINYGTSASNPTGLAGTSGLQNLNVMALLNFLPPQPSVTVFIPNGGEVGLVGNFYQISANIANVSTPPLATLNFSWVRYASAASSSPVVDSGAITSLNNIGNGNVPFGWLIPSNMVQTNSYKVKAELCHPSIPGGCVSDLSDGFFAISNANITITSPNGGERWRTNTTRQITWTSVNVPANNYVNLGWKHYPSASSPAIDYDASGAISSFVAPNTGSYNWLIPPSLATSTPYYRIEIGTHLSIGGGAWSSVSLGDESDNTFSIGGISLNPTNPLPEPAVTAMLKSRGLSGNVAALAGLDLVSTLRRILDIIASRQR